MHPDPADRQSQFLRAVDCPVVVLAGGRSSRFGSDKALVEVDGQPLLRTLVDALHRQGHPAVSIVADRADRYQQLGLTCLVDHTPDCGPLGGVATALQQRLQSGPGWLLLVSCDQLVFRPEWFEQLALHAVSSQLQNLKQHLNPQLRLQEQIEHDVVHFVSGGVSGEGRVEPLPSLLHTRLLPTVLERLERRELSLQKLFAGVAAAGVRADSTPGDWTFNTPHELQQLVSNRTSGFPA